jgi:hypothetical protein
MKLSFEYFTTNERSHKFHVSDIAQMTNAFQQTLRKKQLGVGVKQTLQANCQSSANNK